MIRRCRRCAAEAKKPSASAGTVQLYRGELWHAGRLERHLRRVGEGLNVYWAVTACGLGFEEEVDSSG